MDLKTIGEFISVVGFPCLACIGLAKYFSKRDEKNEKDLDKMRETVDNNTRAIQEMKTANESINQTINSVNHVISELLQYIKGVDSK